MTIFSVALTMHSTVRSVDELSAYAGAAPTRSHVMGERRSLRLPETSGFRDNSWALASGVEHDTRTLDAHWATLAPVLETIARGTLDREITLTLSIGTNARGTGYAFDLLPEQIDLLARAGCGVWIDSYPPTETDELPDDHPQPTA